MGDWGCGAATTNAKNGGDRWLSVGPFTAVALKVEAAQRFGGLTSLSTTEPLFHPRAGGGLGYPRRFWGQSGEVLTLLCVSSPLHAGCDHAAWIRFKSSRQGSSAGRVGVARRPTVTRACWFYPDFSSQPALTLRLRGSCVLWETSWFAMEPIPPSTMIWGTSPGPLDDPDSTVS